MTAKETRTIIKKQRDELLNLMLKKTGIKYKD